MPMLVPHALALLEAIDPGLGTRPAAVSFRRRVHGFNVTGGASPVYPLESGKGLRFDAFTAVVPTFIDVLWHTGDNSCELVTHRWECQSLR